MIDIRTLKIHTKFRNRTRDSIKVPEIRLEGKWLEELGFKQGMKVTVRQHKNKLIITPKTDENIA